MAQEQHAIEIAPPDIAPYRAGNTGIDYVTSFAASAPGPHVVVNGLTHGNELCGAIAIDHLFRSELRPALGKLTLTLANVAAYRGFDAANASASRFVDEDLNRLWDEATLGGPRHSAELNRARALQPVFASADFLLDIHSMQHDTAPLILTGLAAKSLAFARRLGLPELIVRDAGHRAGKRLLDYGAFADPAKPAIALLVECGQHWRRKTADFAIAAARRFIAAAGVLAEEQAQAILAPTTPPPRIIEVTHAITIASESFRFAEPYRGLEVIAGAGTLIAQDGEREIRTPYDGCVLIMPSRRLTQGQTAVRLGRFAG